MVYEVKWKRKGALGWIATSDERVVQATKSLTWAIGKQLYTVTEWAEGLHAEVVLRSVHTTLNKELLCL